MGGRQDRRPAALVDPRGRREGDRRWRDRAVASRQRPAPSASRRTGRHLPLGRPRLEPDHRARPGGDRGRAADLLGRVPRRPIRRARAPGGGRRGDRHPASRRRRGDDRRSPARFRTSSVTPRLRSSGRRRCRCSCSLGRSERTGSPSLPAARAPTSCSGDTTCSRRSRSASSTARPRAGGAALDQLYSTWGTPPARRGPAWRRFLLETGAEDRTLGSHLTRVEATATVKALYRSELAERIGAGTSLDRLRSSLPRAFDEWSALERASWLEVATLLEPYLLAAQGDRVAMAHGVEGRYPFLDHRVFAHRCGPSGRAKARRAARQGRAARARPPPPAAPRSPLARSSPTGRPRSRRSSPRARPGGSRRSSRGGTR